jgi:hypothetical protein
MERKEDETMVDLDDVVDTFQDVYDDDSEIDGDCNESQPRRGDEPGLEKQSRLTRDGCWSPL